MKKKRVGGPDNMDYFIIYLLDRKNEYDRVKKMLTSLDILSQVIAKPTAKRINLSIASNIIK